LIIEHGYNYWEKKAGSKLDKESKEKITKRYSRSQSAVRVLDILVRERSPIKRGTSRALLSKIIRHSLGTRTNSEEMTLKTFIRGRIWADNSLFRNVDQRNPTPLFANLHIIVMKKFGNGRSNK